MNTVTIPGTTYAVTYDEESGAPVRVHPVDVPWYDTDAATIGTLDSVAHGQYARFGQVGNETHFWTAHITREAAAIRMASEWLQLAGRMAS